MKLSVLERILVINLLPNEGSFNNLKILREAKEALSFSDKENKLLKFVTSPNGMVSWEPKASAQCSKDFAFSDYITLKIIDALRALDKDERLTDNQAHLYEMFVLPVDKEKPDG